MSIKYYGVAGVAGYGVYDDYEKVLESRRFIKKFINKKFSNIEDAKQWAVVDTFEELKENCIKGFSTY